MGENPREVEEFYNVQSLETLGKLRDVAGNVWAVLDKLKGIKSDLVRGDMKGDKSGILDSYCKRLSVGKTSTQ